MPNNTRTQPDGTWVDGYVPPPSDWADLERKIFGSWNGDKGGAYCAPSFSGGSAWTFGGSGLQVTGPTRLTYGGSLKGANGAFVIRDGSWPELGSTHSARSRSLVCPIYAYNIPPPSTSLSSSKMGRIYLWSRRHPYAGIGSVALAVRATNSRIIETPEFYTPLRVIDGSTLTSVRIYFRVATKRLLAPIAMPKLRVMRVPRDTGGSSRTILPEPLKSTSDGQGFDFLPLVTTPDAWYNDGNVQFFDYVCDQNNVIDVSKYDYVVHLIEEAGASNPDETFDGVRLVERKADVYVVGSGSVTLSNSQVLDGFGSNNERVLVTDSDAVIDADLDSSASNGIWQSNSTGAWTRTADCDEPADFTPNWLVFAVNGDINQSAVWQCQFPSSNQRIDLGKTQICIRPAEPKGNIYHALVPTFEVSDLRFQ